MNETVNALQEERRNIIIALCNPPQWRDEFGAYTDEWYAHMQNLDTALRNVNDKLNAINTDGR